MLALIFHVPDELALWSRGGTLRRSIQPASRLWFDDVRNTPFPDSFQMAPEYERQGSQP